MRSATSFFDKTLLRTDVRRYWPLLFFYTGIWIVLMPVKQWAEADYMMRGTGRFVGDHIYDMMVAGIVMAVIFGFLFAAALFSYLMNSRSVGLMHSLPATRTQQFFSHFLAGMGMMAAGKLLTVVLTVLVQGLLYDGVAWSALFQWFLVCTVMELFFFSLGILCCVATGWLPAAPVFYAAANSFLWLATLLLRALGGLFYFGYTSGGSFPAITRWGTPLYLLPSVLDETVRLYENEQYVAQTMAGTDILTHYTTRGPRIFNPDAVLPLVVYGVIALVLLALAWLLYRSRKSESAGDPVAFGWARPVIRTGIAFYGGLSFGLGLYSIFRNYNYRVGFGALIFCMVLMGAMWCFAADMVIRKTFHVFRSGWKNAAAVCAILILLCIGAKMDITGYETRVPQPEKVTEAWVNLNYDSVYLNCTEPETIEAIVALHKAVIDEGNEEYLGGDWYSVRVEYDLADGTSLRRDYHICRTDARKSGIYDAAAQLLKMEEVRRNVVLGQKSDVAVAMDSIRGGYINSHRTNESVQLTADQAKALYQALLDDLAAGAGVVEPMNNERLTATISIELDADTNGLWTNELPPDCVNTVAYLNELGFDTVAIFGATEEWLKENGYDTMTYPVVSMK